MNSSRRCNHPLLYRPPSCRQLFSCFRFALLLALCSTLVACTGNRAPRSPGQVDVLQLLAVDGERLILVTPSTGEHQELAVSPLLQDVSALAFDAESGLAYAIANSSSAPRLLRITPGSGEVVTVSPIELPPVSAGTADAMVFDPGSRQLLVAAGGKGLSDYLVSLDPQTGAATRMGRIRDTPQGELDGLVWVRGEFYAIDFVSEETHFFRLTLEETLLTPIGKIVGKVTDLAADSGSGRLFVAVDGHLAMLQTQGELSVTPISNAPALTALTLISTGPVLLSDGFEAGDLSAWSESSKN